MKKAISIVLFFLFSSLAYAETEAVNWWIKTIWSQIDTKNVKWFKKLKLQDLFSWAWVFELPMNFPGWPKNINVNLSLNYNSYSKDAFSPYWYAWDLSTQLIYRDSKKWIDKMYKENDFIFNWEELIKTWENLYESKNANDRSKLYFDWNNWIVKDDKWNSYYFWTSDNWKLFDPKNKEKIFSWHLEKQIDINWFEIKYSYFKDKNQVYLDKIEYAFENWNPLYEIKLNYIDKKRSLSSYRTQFKIETSKLLNEIVFKTKWSEIKKYQLTYDNKDGVFSHLIWFREIDIEWNIFKNYNFQYWKWKNQHILEKVENSKWLKVEFEYKPSVFYKKNWKLQNPKLPFNLKTLHKIKYEDISIWNKLEEFFDYSWWYYYYNKNDIRSREYAGFHKVEKTDSSWKKEIFYFHQWENSFDWNNYWEFEDHIFKKWNIYRIEVYDWEKLYKTEINKWIKIDKSNKRYSILLDTNIEINHSNWKKYSKASSYKYDEFWNDIKINNYWEISILNEKWNFEDIKNDNIIIKNSYANNLEKNLFWFISSVEIFWNNWNLESKKEYKYDNLEIWEVDLWNLTNELIYENQNEYLEKNNKYNEKWLLIRSTDPNENSIFYEYDKYNLYITKTTNSLNFSEEFEYNYEVWKIKKHKNINWLENKIIRDSFWRKKSEYFFSDKEYKIKEYSYNNSSIPNFITEKIYFNENLDNKKSSISYLDSFWRVIENKQSYKDKFVTSKIKYDKKWNKEIVFYPTFEDNSDYSWIIDLEKWNKYSYDVLWRVKQIENKSWVVKYKYDWFWFTIFNQKNISSSYKYDAYWNLIEVIEPWEYSTKYFYDSVWNLKKIIDSKWNERNFSYNLLWLRIFAEDLHNPNDEIFWTQEYKYDKNWNLIELKTLWNESIFYNYDKLNRVTLENLWNKETKFFYDEWISAKWKLTSVEKWIYWENYYYNIYWNLIWETKKYWNEKYNLSYEYNLVWNLLKTTYPDWKSSDFKYKNGSSPNRLGSLLLHTNLKISNI